MAAFAGLVACSPASPETAESAQSPDLNLWFIDVVGETPDRTATLLDMGRQYELKGKKYVWGLSFSETPDEDGLVEDRMLIEFDCRSQTMAMGQITSYDTEGQRVESHHDSIGELEPVVPGTLGDAEYTLICKGRRKNNTQRWLKPTFDYTDAKKIFAKFDHAAVADAEK